MPFQPKPAREFPGGLVMQRTNNPATIVRIKNLFVQ